MEIESIFLDSKWKILNELSQSDLSPSELAEKTKTSLANISAQIRLLEALDFIEMKKTNNISKGEPRKIYSLKKEFSYLILGTKFFVGKKMFKLDKEIMPFFLSIMINNREISFILLKFLVNYNLNNISSIALIDYNLENNFVDLLIISQNLNDIKIENNNENQIIKHNEKEYNVKLNIIEKNEMFIRLNSLINEKNETVNKEEKETIKNKNYKEIIKKSFILLDDGFLNEIKKDLI